MAGSRSCPKGIAGLSSPDGSELAYWNSEKHELHLRSVANGNDTIADSLPDFISQAMHWSSKGRALIYPVNTTNPIRYRILNLDSGKRSIVEEGLTRILGAPDPGHLLAIGQNTVERISVSDGRHEALATVKFPNDAEYSPSGTWLAIQVPAPDGREATDDDTPDRTGGTYALVLQKTDTRQLLEIPFPDGFDTVLDFAFSPDDRALAVTFDADACDYPGDKARVYFVSLPNLALTPLSPANRLSVQPHWSPDCQTIVYSDFSEIAPPLIAVDVRAGKASNLTNPAQNGNVPDIFISWR